MRRLVKGLEFFLYPQLNSIRGKTACAASLATAKTSIPASAPILEERHGAILSGSNRSTAAAGRGCGD